MIFFSIFFFTSKRSISFPIIILWIEFPNFNFFITLYSPFDWKEGMFLRCKLIVLLCFSLSLSVSLSLPLSPSLSLSLSLSHYHLFSRYLHLSLSPQFRSWTVYDDPVPGVRVCVRQVSPFLPNSYSETSLPVCVFHVDVENTGEGTYVD